MVRILVWVFMWQEVFHSDKNLWSTKGLPKPIQDNEDVVFVVREDLAILVFKMLELLLVFTFLLLVRLVVASFLEVGWVALYDTVFFSLNTILILKFALFFHNYYLSFQIVTNLRVIDIEQNGLFNRRANQLALKNIQNITYKQGGLLAYVFNYGDVIIETAGQHDPVRQDGGFVFQNVPKPATIVEKLKALSLDKK